MNCPVCHESNTICLRVVYDDRYAYPGEFSVLKCTNCGHKFLQHIFTEEEIGNVYTNYYPRSSLKLDQYKPHSASSPFYSWFNGEKSSAYRWVPSNTTILDIGCGFGESLGYHTERGCDVYGIEADKNIKRVAEKFGYKVHVGVFESNLYEDEFFDYVTMDQVIEHVIDPAKLFRGVAKILKTDGHLIASTPNVEGWGAWVFGQRWINWHAPYHLHYFSKKSLEMLAENQGFKLDNVYTITSSEWLFYQWQHILMYPDNGDRSVFWNKIYQLPKWKKVLLRLIIKLHKWKMDHILTRIFDGIGYGDNKVYIFRKSTD